jgi:hypothetical protein
MCLPHNITVCLYKSGRYFYCPYCHRSHQHPPCDLEYYCIGYGFCDLYMCWFPIAGGDGLGIVKVNGNCERYTVLWSKDNPRPQPAR